MIRELDISGNRYNSIYDMRRLLLIIPLLFFCFLSGRCDNAKKFQFGTTFNMTASLDGSTRMLEVSGGRRFNPIRYFGLGTGIGRVRVDPPHNPDEFPEYREMFYDIPIFLDYQRYFPFRRNPRHSLILGIEGGVTVFPEKYFDSRITPHIRLNTGFDVSLARRLGLKFGFSLYYFDMDYTWSSVGFGNLFPMPCLGLFAGLRF